MTLVDPFSPWDLNVNGPGEYTPWDDVPGGPNETRWDLLPAFIGRGQHVIWDFIGRHTQWQSIGRKVEW